MTATIRAPRVPVVNRLVLGLVATAQGRRLLYGLTALRFTGRRTGRQITVPVAYAAAGDDIAVLVGRSAAKRWWRNFHDGHPVGMLVDGRWRRGVGEAVTPKRLEHPRLLAAYRSGHPDASIDLDDPVVLIVLPATSRGPIVISDEDRGSP